MKRPIKDFRDLEIWQLGVRIVRDIYVLTERFPRKEIYGLASQMRRAAVSIPSNIAEGFDRFHTRDFIRFLLVARGSCSELETHVELSAMLNYIPEETRNTLVDELKLEGRKLNRLIYRLRHKHNGQ